MAAPSPVVESDIEKYQNHFEEVTANTGALNGH